MLKLIYTEDAIYVEQLVESLEEIVIGRVQLAMRVNQPITITSGSISVLIPRQHPKVPKLQAAIQQEQTQVISICMADSDNFEVSFTGTWIRESFVAQTGIFLAEFSHKIELILCQIWQDKTELGIHNLTHQVENKS